MQIIPISTHLELIKNIVAAAGPQHKFLIDGFPKALDQARAFEEQARAPAQRVILMHLLYCDASHHIDPRRALVARLCWWVGWVSHLNDVISFTCLPACLPCGANE